MCGNKSRCPGNPRGRYKIVGCDGGKSGGDDDHDDDHDDHDDDYDDHDAEGCFFNHHILVHKIDYPIIAIVCHCMNVNGNLIIQLIHN